MRFQTALSLLLAAAGTSHASLVSHKPKSPVDASTYGELVHYANYAGAAYADICNRPPFGSKVLEYINITSTDTQATVFQDDAAKEIILAYQGSVSQQDIVTDFNFVPVPYKSDGTICDNCLVHKGFYLAWTSIQNASTIALQKALADTSDYKVVILGHSLGGAIAQHAFFYFKPLAPFAVRTGYSYGQPRVGNLAFTQGFDKVSGNSNTAGTYFRVTHANDGVPQLPPILLGFQHSLTEFWEASNVSTLATTYRCYGQEPADCNDAQGGIFINEAHGSYAGLDYSCDSTG